MKITSTEQVRMGQMLVLEGQESVVVEGINGSHMIWARWQNTPPGGMEGCFWIDLNDTLLEDVDTDEERQRLHDGSIVDANQDYSVVMGPVSRVAFGAVGDRTVHVNPTGAGPAAKLLEESLEILVERGKRYDNERGSPSITTTARLWDAYLDAFALKGGELTETEVCEMIALHKIARRLQDRAGRDHHPDMINYLALAGAYAREEQEDDR